MSSPIDLTEELEDQLPPGVINDWLPIRGESVFHLFVFNKYPANKTNYMMPPDFAPVLHEEVVMDFDYDTLPHLGLPVNPSVTEAYQAAIKSAKHLVHSITLIPHPGSGESLTLPTWIFHYWREIGLAALYQEQWKTALVWLQQYSELPMTANYCQELLMALSFFPWSGGRVSIKDIAYLLSEGPPKSYLSDFHINYVTEQISGQHQDLRGPEFSRCNILTTSYLLESITTFYGHRITPQKQGNELWEKLMIMENAIFRGEIDSLGGVLHLPLHWVSVVFDLQKGIILYGDSFGQPLPTVERSAFTRWIKHVRSRPYPDTSNNPVPVHILPTGRQEDITSCGLFALNTIRHHYLGHQLLPSDRMSLVYNRMEVTLDILQGNTV